MAKCKYCGKDITWMKDGRKNVPVENDGTTHECTEYRNTRGSLREVQVSDIDPEILKQYQESINKKNK